MTGAEKRAWVNYEAEAEEEDLILFDGLDDAIVGIVRVHTRPGHVAYSREKIIEALMEDMSYDDAVEYFEFNIACLWAGEHTPAILYEPSED